MLHCGNLEMILTESLTLPNRAKSLRVIGLATNKENLLRAN